MLCKTAIKAWFWFFLKITLSHVVNSEKCADAVCLQCLPTIISIRVNTKVLLSDENINDLEPKWFTFADDVKNKECHADSAENDDELSLKLQLNKNCGSTVEVLEKKKKISNNIKFYNVTADEYITLYNFTCLYEDDESLKIVHDTQRIITNQKGDSVKVSLEMFRDSRFTKSSNFALMSFPSLKIPQLAYVRLGYDPQLDFTNQVQVESCYAAESGDLHNNHTFIDNRCPNRTDSSVKIVANHEKNFIWRFESFRWTAASHKSQHLYLVCFFYRCEYNSTEKCKFNTNQNKACDFELNEHSSKNPNKFALSFGPFFIDDQNPLSFEGKQHKSSTIKSGGDSVVIPANKDNEVSTKLKNTAIIAGITCGTFFLIAIIAICCVIKKKFHLIYGPRFNIKEDKIQPGFAFVLRSSNDVPLVNFDKDPTSAPASYNTLS